MLQNKQKIIPKIIDILKVLPNKSPNKLGITIKLVDKIIPMSFIVKTINKLHKNINPSSILFMFL